MNTTAGPNDPCPCGSGKKYKKCHMGSRVPVGAGVAASPSPLDRYSVSEFGKSLLNFGKGSDDRVVPPTRRITPRPLSPKRPVPDYIPKPEYAVSGKPNKRGGKPLIKSKETLARMREACIAARKILNTIVEHAQAGVTTDELDAICHEETLRIGAYPSPLNYGKFPKSLCTSVNEVVCHGIPADLALVDGDIINCDVTVYLNGVHGDTNQTVFIGKPDPVSRRLVEDTYEAMMVGIETVRPGGRIRDIGRAIETFGRARRYGVVRQFCGHGIGEYFHMEPSVPHFYDSGATMEMIPGMTFTVEPMINLGDYRCDVWDDDWTAVTADLKRSAQFEHTVLVTASGCEILTDIGDGQVYQRQLAEFNRAEAAAQAGRA